MKFTDIFESKIINVDGEENSKLLKDLLSQAKEQYSEFIKNNYIILSVRNFTVAIVVGKYNIKKYNKDIISLSGKMVNGYDFNINTYLKILTHELQHYIQTKTENGIKIMDLMDNQIKKYANKKDVAKIVAYKDLHSQLEIERDASLAAVLYAIQNKLYGRWERIKLDNSEYFSDLSYKKFIHKAFSFGLNNDDIVKFQTKYKQYLDQVLGKTYTLWSSQVDNYKKSGKPYYKNFAIKIAKDYLNFAKLSITFLDKDPEKLSEIMIFLRDNTDEYK
jgi:hypothetical protein